MKKSLLEELAYNRINQSGLPLPSREYVFCAERKFRFDFAWPVHRIAVEIEGGVFSRGRHTRPMGFIKDCEKYNMAALHGWRVLRYTTANLGMLINDLEWAIKGHNS